MFEEKPEEKKEKAVRVFGYSPFALQDAIGAKDVKQMWLEYRRLRLEDIEAEEIIHNIISKLRDLLSIMNGATKEDLSIKNDFPFNKSKRDLKNWKREELQAMYTKFVFAYHHSRMGRNANNFDLAIGDPLDLAIEKIILNG